MTGLDRTALRRLPLPLQIEIEENIQRKAFTESELAGIQRRLIAELSRPEHKRQGERADLKPAACTEPSVQVAGKPKRCINTTERVAAIFGESERHVRKRLEVVAAAEADPVRFGKLRKDMDRTGRVDGPYKRLVVARKAEAIRKEPPPLPGSGPYRVIVADPPWPYELRAEDLSHRAAHPYPQMSIADICALPVASIAHDDCILWLWTTNHHRREAFAVLDAWDFEHKTILTWVKDHMGTGDWLRGQTEHCFMAVRGKPTVQLTNQTTVLYGPMRANSQKPDEFYALVESLCPAPRYAELFQRTARPGWDGHGDEARPAPDPALGSDDGMV